MNTIIPMPMYIPQDTGHDMPLLDSKLKKKGVRNNIRSKNYCGFKTHEALVEDHKKLKLQISEREKKIDALGEKLSYSDIMIERCLEEEDEDIKDEILGELTEMSQEMFSINN